MLEVASQFHLEDSIEFSWNAGIIEMSRKLKMSVLRLPADLKYLRIVTVCISFANRIWSYGFSEALCKLPPHSCLHRLQIASDSLLQPINLTQPSSGEVSSIEHRTDSGRPVASTETPGSSCWCTRNFASMSAARCGDLATAQ